MNVTLTLAEPSPSPTAIKESGNIVFSSVCKVHTGVCAGGLECGPREAHNLGKRASPPAPGPSTWKGGSSMSLPDGSPTEPFKSCLVLSCSWRALASWESTVPVLNSHFDHDPSFNSNVCLTAPILQQLQRGHFYSTLQERQELQVSEGLSKVLSRTEGLPTRGDVEQEKPLPRMCYSPMIIPKGWLKRIQGMGTRKKGSR